MSTIAHPPAASSGEGARRRDAAVDRHLSTRDPDKAAFLAAGEAALLQALRDGPCTVAFALELADVHLPDGCDPRTVGAIPLSLARRGLIHRTGYTTSHRATSHAAPVSLWALTASPANGRA